MSTTDREELPATLPASSTAPAPVDAALPDLLALADTERLQLGDLVGRGGMGEVWACRDQHLGRELAFKTVTAPDDTARARFVREARVQGQLEHPGVVPVHELGVLSAATMVLPIALQALGVIEPFYVFEQGRLVVVPHALNFDPTATLVMLTVAGVATMWISAVSMMSARTALEDAQRQLALQRWTLAQLGGGN